MNTLFEKNYAKNYIVLEDFQEYDYEKDYQLDMIKFNSIPGALNLSVEMRDNEPVLKYDITSKQSFSSLFTTANLSYKAYISIVLSLIDFIGFLDEYLIDINSIIMRTQYIFLDPEKYTTYFTICPGCKNDFYQDLRDFFNDTLNILDHSDDQLVLLAYSLSNESSKEGFNISQLKSLVYKRMNNSVPLSVVSSNKNNSVLDSDNNKTNSPLKSNYISNHDSNYISNYNLTQNHNINPNIALQFSNDPSALIDSQQQDNQFLTNDSLSLKSYQLNKEPSVDDSICLKEAPNYFTSKNHDYFSKSIFNSSSNSNFSSNSDSLPKSPSDSSISLKIPSLKRKSSSVSSAKISGGKITTLSKPFLFKAAILLTISLLLLIASLFVLITQHFSSKTGLILLILDIAYTIGSIKYLMELYPCSKLLDIKERKLSPPKELPKAGYSSNQLPINTDISSPRQILSANSELLHSEEFGDTVILSHNTKKTDHKLVYSGTDFTSEVDISHYPFTIGKLQSSVNMVINNPLISRIHACIHYNDGTFYLEDLNSANGTFINEVLLSPHSKQIIHSGDKLTFSHLSYIFE